MPQEIRHSFLIEATNRLTSAQSFEGARYGRVSRPASPLIRLLD
jgi:hypothetical protein